MRPNKEKKEKPLKKIKTIKKQKEEEEQAIKPAVRIQELKNKLIILAHELKVDKKINDTLYRKMQLLTYSRTTEQKLKDSYKTLKDINDKIDSQKNETNQKRKKITVKDLNQIKRLLMMIKIYYTMYILNIKFGISLMHHLIMKIINYLYLMQVMKFILNGKLIILLYKHMGKTILLIILKNLLKWHSVIHTHTKLKY